ncbi:hypothetical protein [Methanobacterium sp. ACI-7]|uniref:hypothetical protein n=1 Tax=unclassified Methanobacterium TaxID=2627676 RepID=UPI0039C41DC2
MDWFSILLAFTVVIRGLGAGMISDVALVSLPVRKQIGAISYSKYVQATYSGNGVKTYGSISILGLILTIAVTIGTFIRGEPAIISWLIVIALIATIIAFIGTSRALPAMLSLREAPDDEVSFSKILDRFARWHTFSAVWQVIAFIILVIALAY